MADQSRVTLGVWLLGCVLLLSCLLAHRAPAWDAYADLDWDGDALADPWMMSNGTWTVWLSSMGFRQIPSFSLGADGQPVAADFDGDGLADPSLMDTTGMWWLWPSSRMYALDGGYALGVTGWAAAGDLDGDRRADPVVATTGGLWHAWLSAANYAQVTQPMNVSGQPLVADFDGDRRGDLVVVAADGAWHIWLSSRNFDASGAYVLGAGKSPLAGDFDGDGLADPAVRTGTNTFCVWISSEGYRMQGPLVPGRCLDLVTDTDADDIPDELEQRVDAILDMGKQASSRRAMTAAESNVLFNAMFSLCRQYEAQADTIKLQTEYASLLERLTSESVTNDADMAMIAERMDAIENDLREDPSFALFVDAMDRIGEAKARAAGFARPRYGVSPVFSQLKRGDVMLVHNGGLMGRAPYALSFSHAGTYDGNSLVYEATWNEVALQSIENSFKHEGMRVAFGRSRVSSASDVQVALSWAQMRWGTTGSTKYSILFYDKEREYKLYCSQLVWKIHKYLGVDVDSNDEIYHLKAAAYASLAGIPNPCAMLRYATLCYAVIRPGVMPDEIFWDKNIAFYADGIYRAAADSTPAGPSRIEVLTLPRKGQSCKLRSKGEYNPMGTPFLYSWTVIAGYADGTDATIVASVDISGQNTLTFTVPNDRRDGESGQMVSLSRLSVRLQTKTDQGVTQTAITQAFRMQ